MKFLVGALLLLSVALGANCVDTCVIELQKVAAFNYGTTLYTDFTKMIDPKTAASYPYDSFNSFCTDAASVTFSKANIDTVVANLINNNCLTASYNIDATKRNGIYFLKQGAAIICYKENDQFCRNSTIAVIQSIPVNSTGLGFEDVAKLTNAQLTAMCTPCSISFAKYLLLSQLPSGNDDVKSLANLLLNVCLKDESNEFCIPKFANYAKFFAQNTDYLLFAKSDPKFFLEAADRLCSSSCLLRASAFIGNEAMVTEMMGKICSRAPSGKLCISELSDNSCIKCVLADPSNASGCTTTCAASLSTLPDQLTCCADTFAKKIMGSTYKLFEDSQLAVCKPTTTVSAKFTLSNIASSVTTLDSIVSEIQKDLKNLFGGSVTVSCSVSAKRVVAEVTAASTGSTDFEVSHKNYEVATALQSGSVIMPNTGNALLSSGQLASPTDYVSASLTSSVPSKPSSYPSSTAQASGAGSITLSVILVALVAFLSVFAL